MESGDLGAQLPVVLATQAERHKRHSPGGQTLASLKAEGMQERSKRTTSKRGRQATSFASQGARRKVTRSCKIMKEAYFKGMEWTRTFVSGPVDPRWNKFIAKFVRPIFPSTGKELGKFCVTTPPKTSEEGPKVEVRVPLQNRSDH